MDLCACTLVGRVSVCVTFLVIYYCRVHHSGIIYYHVSVEECYQPLHCRYAVHTSLEHTCKFEFLFLPSGVVCMDARYRTGDGSTNNQHNGLLLLQLRETLELYIPDATWQISLPSPSALAAGLRKYRKLVGGKKGYHFEPLRALLVLNSAQPSSINLKREAA